MTNDEQNNSSDTGTKVPTYRCAYCHGKIVTCNCEKGFKSAVENATIEEIIKDIERFHMAGCMAGTKCDRGLCTCDDIAGLIRVMRNFL